MREEWHQQKVAGMQNVFPKLSCWVTIVSRRTANTNALPSELVVETALKGRHATAFSVDPGCRYHCYDRTPLHGCCCQCLQTYGQGMMYTNGGSSSASWLE
jgi:hypothetical protein